MARSTLKLAKRQALRRIGHTGPRKSRLSVPKVNPNPQPPNADNSIQPTPVPNWGDNSIQSAGPVADWGNNEIKPTKPTPTLAPSTPQVTTPNIQAALESTNPIDPQSYFSSAWQPAPGQVDPRDSTYWSNLNKLLFEAQQGYQQNRRDQAYSEADWGVKQQDFENTRKSNERKIAEAMIRQGLAFSGRHDVEQADTLREHLSNVSQAQTSKTREDQAREVARAAILQGFGIDMAAQMAEAVARQQEAAERAADREAALLGSGEEGGGSEDPGFGRRPKRGGSSRHGRQRGKVAGSGGGRKSGRSGGGRRK